MPKDKPSRLTKLNRMARRVQNLVDARDDGRDVEPIIDDLNLMLNNLTRSNNAT